MKDRQGPTIVIAGGTGRLGRILVERFVARGEMVRVLSRAPGRPGTPASSRAVQIVASDVRDRDAVDRSLSGARIVVSAMSAFGLKGVTPRQVDLEGNANLIAACERHGVDHFILVSVRGAAPHHPMELHRMKYLAEQELTRSRLSWTILRPSSFTETFQQVLCAPLLETGKTIVFGRARNPINFVSVHNVAQFIERASADAALRGTIIDVGGPENLSLEQFVEAFAIATGARGPVKKIPLPMMRLMSVVLRPFNPTFARMVRAGVVMDTTDMSFDAADLQRRFPEISLTTAAEVARRDYATVRPREH